MGPLLLVTAAALALVSMRIAPSELVLDPGTAAPVVVAADELAPGTVVDADQVEVRGYPLGAIPPGAATDPEAVVGRVVIATIVAGEPVVGSRLAPDGLVGLAAVTPPGWSSFALPVGADVPELAVGQAVDLYASDPTSELAVSASTAHRIAREARVVAVDDARVTVAVAAADATAVATALIGSTVVTAVTGPTSPGGRPGGP